MRRALEPVNRAAQTAKVATIPAPIGGWDAQSPLAAMDVKNAVILDNFIPRPGYVELRKGSFLQASNVGASAIQTLMAWRGPTTDKLLACAAGSIYDVTVTGTSGPSALYSAATSAAWAWTNFENSAGSWVIACNGHDTPIKYDGTSVTTTSLTWAGTPPPTFDATKLSLVMAHKRRLHFGEANSLRVWFCTSTDAISGPVGLLDLGPVFTEGGALAAMGTCSLWYSTGIDDFAVYVSTKGQVAVYQGIDPGNAGSWSLVGVYNLGYPMGPRSLVKYGSDLAVITTMGVIPLSSAIKLDRAQDNNVAITQRIQNAFQQSAAAYPAGLGWQGMLYPAGALAIFNVPSSPAVQYVQNIQTGAWCRFTGMDAACWALANGLPYYASGTSVYQWDIGADDFGTAITYDLKSAFYNYRTPGQKRFTMLRPLMQAASWVTPQLEIDVDFKESVPTATPIVVQTSNLVAIPRYDWSSAQGIGFVGAVRMRVMLTVQGTSNVAIDSGDVDELVDGAGNYIVNGNPIPVVPFQLTSFDVAFEPGGVL